MCLLYARYYAKLFQCTILLNPPRKIPAQQELLLSSFSNEKREACQVTEQVESGFELEYPPLKPFWSSSSSRDLPVQNSFCPESQPDYVQWNWQ